jgi:hypothetical protein
MTEDSLYFIFQYTTPASFQIRKNSSFLIIFLSHFFVSDMRLKHRHKISKVLSNLMDRSPSLDADSWLR